MPAFVLKIGIDYAPEGAFKPKSPDEWEGETFRAPTARSVRYSENTAQDPKPGDKLFIWTHHYRKREREPGEGLKATCVATEVVAENDGYQITVENVQFVNPPIDRYRFQTVEDQSPVVFSLLSVTTTQTLYLDDEETADFESAISSIMEARNAEFPAHLVEVHNEALSAAVAKEEWKAERVFRQQLVEVRPKQSAFRKALLDRYEGRCCVTGFDALDALEAAHIYPFASGHDARDYPENGLLLRADIHKLFDSLLVAINPDDDTVWLSPKLAGTEYEVYAGKVVQHFASVNSLKAHYNQAIKEAS